MSIYHDGQTTPLLNVFVYLFRKALESDYVSCHLNEWIDLIWGFKQKGENAKKAHNIFLPNMYETSWTQQTLKDPRRRAEIEAIMCHVGQIPTQLFFAEHPQRNIRPKRNSVQTAIVQLPYTDIKIASMYHSKTNGHLMLSLVSSNSNQVVASLELSLADHSTNIINNISSELQTDITEIDTFVTNNEIVMLQSNGKLIHMLDEIIDSVHPELSYVSTFAISKHFTAAVSDNTTLNLFSPDACIRYSIPFYGDAILCCAISETFKVAVCGTLSGLIICSLYEGKKINAIQFDSDLKPIKILITNSWGFIVTYAIKKSIQGKPKPYLIVHTINGKLLRSVEIQIPIVSWYSFSSFDDFDYLVISNEQGKLHLIEVFYLNIEDPFYRCNKNIVSICYLKKPKVIAALIEDGNIAFLPIDV